MEVFAKLKQGSHFFGTLYIVEYTTEFYGQEKESGSSETTDQNHQHRDLSAKTTAFRPRPILALADYNQ